MAFLNKIIHSKNQTVFPCFLIYFQKMSSYDQSYYYDQGVYGYAVYPQYYQSPPPPVYYSHYHTPVYPAPYQIPEYNNLPENIQPKITTNNEEIVKQVKMVCEASFSNAGLSKVIIRRKKLIQHVTFLLIFSLLIYGFLSRISSKNELFISDIF
jgi:hypothetical protein